MLFCKTSKLAHLLLAVLLRCNALAPHESTDPRSAALGLLLLRGASSAQNPAFSVLSENVMQHLSV